MRDTKWVVGSERDNENATAVRREQNAGVKAQGEIGQSSDLEKYLCESERCALGSSIAETSKSKWEKGQVRQSRR